MQGRTLVMSCLSLFSAFFITSLYAGITVPMDLFEAKGQVKNIGTISLEDSLCGVLLTPHLTNLSSGIHGFHVHVNPSCEDNGMAAGGHLDPDKVNEHNGPYRKHSHLGDLPVLIVNQDGRASLPTLAPRFHLADLRGHALIIHAGADNYSDHPEKLGGGGERIACGVIH